MDSDVDSYGTDEAGDVQAMNFVKDLIVTPPMTRGKAEIESDAPATVKRNLSKVFDKVAEGRTKVRLKMVKIEND
jgi:hypothetical protein